MPRVPVLDGRSVLPGQPQPSIGPAQVEPDYSAARQWQSVAQAVGQVGAAVDRGLERMKAADEKATQEAEAVAEANTMLELDGRAQRRQAEFQKLRGLDASAARADVTKALDDDRQELAAALKSPRARARFLQRSAESLMAYRRQAEAHAGREFEAAREATVKAREGQALGMAEAGVPDFDSWLAVSRGVEHDIRANTRAADGGEAEVAAFRAKSGRALVNGLLAQGRVGEAVKYVDDNRATLGGEYVEAKTAVDRAKAGAEEDAGAAAVGGLVDGAAEAARNEDGYVTEKALRGALPSLEGIGPDARRALDVELHRRMQLEEAKLTDDIKDYRNQAEQAVAAHRPLPGEVRAFLFKYDAKYLVDMEKERDALYRRHRTEGAAEKRDAEKAQIEADKYAHERYDALPDAVKRATDPDEFINGLGVGVSRTMRETIRGLRTKADAKGDTVEDREKQSFLKSVDAAAEGLTRQRGKPIMETFTVGGVKQSASRESMVKDEAGLWFENFVRTNKRVPTDEEQRAKRGELLRSAIEERGWISDKRGLGGVVDFKTRAGAEETKWRQEQSGTPDAGVAAPGPGGGAGAGDEMVPVISVKTSKPGKVPRSKLDAALKAGAVRLP